MAKRIRWPRFLGSLLFLFCVFGYLFLITFSSWLIPDDAGAYRQAISNYYYEELAYSLLPLGFLLLLVRFISWLWQRAKKHPLKRRRQQRQFKTWIWTAVSLLMITFYFSSILWTETYYAYLDSYDPEVISGNYIGINEDQVRVRINNSPESFTLLAPSTVVPHYDEAVIVFKGPKTDRVIVEKAP